MSGVSSSTSAVNVQSTSGTRQNSTQNGSQSGAKFYTYNQPTLNSTVGPQSVPFQKQRFSPYNFRSNSSSSYTRQASPALPTSYSYQVKYGGATGQTTSNNVAVVNDTKDSVILQISNLDSTVEESVLRNFLVSQLKSVTPIISLNFENPSLAKVKVPSQQYAKLVVAHLHRKKIGHKRMIVSYIRDPSSAESSALRCQVAGLLKDVPNYSLPVYKFRELFQSRFKASISVMDLYRMQDICNIVVDKNDEKVISLHPELVVTMKSNPLVESSQHSVPYCIYHFKREQNKGWAEQEIEQLPNVMMSISQIQSVIYGLLKTHKDDIPVASLVHCVENELSMQVVAHESGVNLEHLVCCVRGVQITNNSFGIKVVMWMEHDSPGSNAMKDISDDGTFSKYSKNGPMGDSLTQISREVIELIKMCPKSTMKFNRFIPAYHNHFGKQCRVADYGYTRLIELFEALSNVVQVMGDGESRQITLTHRTQMRRFSTDLLKILRCQANKSILLSQLPSIFSQYQNRPFEITEYGVCDINDVLDGLVHNNSIVVTTVHNGAEVMLSMIKRKQTPTELEKTCIFAGEVVELFRNAPQFSIYFKKFVRSYHYHFGYQCRLSDYGFLKLADLLDAISGVVEMEATNNSDEDRKIFLSHKVALRVFAEQLQELIVCCMGNSLSMIKLNKVLRGHKSKYGYQIQAQNFGYHNMVDVMRSTPFIELFETDGEYWIISHLDDQKFRAKAYAVCYCFHETNVKNMPLSKFLQIFMQKFNDNITEKMLYDMKHAVQIFVINGISMIALTPIMKFILDIVQILETTSPLNLSDLKTMMNMTASTCFNFGYPNISSLVQAFSDIFLSSNATNIHERSDIELNSECIFAKKGVKPLEVAQKSYLLPASEAVIQPPQQPQQPQQPQPQPPQMLPTIPENTAYPIMSCGQQQCGNQCVQAMGRQPLVNISTNRNFYEANTSSACKMEYYNQQYAFNNNNNNNGFNNNNYGNTCGGNSMQNPYNQGAMAMGCNMMGEIAAQSNMLNNENFYYGNQIYLNNYNNNNNNFNNGNGNNNNYNMLNYINNNTSLNPNYSYPNNSCCNNLNMNLNNQSNPIANSGMNNNGTGGKLHERRNVFGLQQLNSGGLMQNTSNSNNNNKVTNSNHYNNIGPFNSCNNLNNGGTKIESSSYNFNYDDLRASLLGFYEPPKPDTPPSKLIPFWVDPIWNNAGESSQTVETLNIHLPELKALSILPVILSPCQISLSVKKNGSFSFDAADINGSK